MYKFFATICLVAVVFLGTYASSYNNAHAEVEIPNLNSTNYNYKITIKSTSVNTANPDDLKKYYEKVNDGTIKTAPADELLKLQTARILDLVQKKGVTSSMNTYINYSEVGGIPVSIEVNGTKVTLANSDFSQKEIAVAAPAQSAATNSNNNTTSNTAAQSQQNTAPVIELNGSAPSGNQNASNQSPAVTSATPVNDPPLNYSGFVKCDGVVKTGVGEKDRNKRCDFNALMETVVSLISWLFYISIPLAATLFAYGGLLYMTGVPGKQNTARSIFTSVGIGFIIMITAWIGVRTIVGWLVADPSAVMFLGG